SPAAALHRPFRITTHDAPHPLAALPIHVDVPFIGEVDDVEELEQHVALKAIGGVVEGFRRLLSQYRVPRKLARHASVAQGGTQGPMNLIDGDVQSPRPEGVYVLTLCRNHDHRR